MNKSKLDKLFSHYVSNFKKISYGQNEIYKWEIVQAFQKNFDLNLGNQEFQEMLNGLWKKSGNLIDNSAQHSFYALVDYAQHDTESVKKLFYDLFEDDHGNLDVRQSKINDFIDGTEELRLKYAPDSWKYVNDQRTVMAYLFLNDPEHNYLYKATQAHEFADCVEFYDNWGTGTNFSLAVYYEMCDEVVAAMRENQELMAANQQRFQPTETRDLYPDPALHILCFDLIYSSQLYGLYNGISYKHLKAAEKKAILKRREDANCALEAYQKAKADMDHLNNVRDYLKKEIVTGKEVRHKIYGIGTVEVQKNQVISVRFADSIGVKRFSLLPAFAGGYLKVNEAQSASYIQKNLKAMRMENCIQKKLELAKENLEPYQDIL